MIKKFLPLILLLFIFIPENQAQIVRCGQQWAVKQLEKQYPAFQKAASQTFEAAKKKYHHTANPRSGVVHQVQVVVHVVYNTEEQNVSDELIHSQIAVLNEDFRKMNADAANARAMYQAISGDAEIEFVLASIDPEGNPTTGITRTQTNVQSFMDIDIGFESILEAAEQCDLDISNPTNLPDSTIVCITQVLLEGGLENTADDSTAIQLDDVKRTARGGKDPWDTERYINIWVTNLNMDFIGQETPALLGFAYPPVGAPNWPEEVFLENLEEVAGVVVHHQAFGRDNPNSGILGDLADGGRTCTHEMGHYFGLRHIHGDGGCTEDDGISDTPSADASQQAQPDPNNLPNCKDLHSIDTCPEDDFPDMIENYMDYNAITCQNLFTIEQVGIMKAMLEGPRFGLIQGTTTSTETVMATQAFKIYPNPTSQLLNLSLEGYDLIDFEIKMSSILGNSISVNVMNANQKIDMSNLENGVYIISLIKENLQIHKKVSLIK